MAFDSQVQRDHAVPTPVCNSAFGKRVFVAPKESVPAFTLCSTSGDKRPRNALDGVLPEPRPTDVKKPSPEKSLSPLARRNKESESSIGKTEYEGVLVRITRHGYGFIECKDLLKKYGRDDIMLRRTTCHQFRVGDRLRFRVWMQDGPVACDVQRIAAMQSFSGKSGKSSGTARRSRSSSSSKPSHGKGRSQNSSSPYRSKSRQHLRKLAARSRSKKSPCYKSKRPKSTRSGKRNARSKKSSSSSSPSCSHHSKRRAGGNVGRDSSEEKQADKSVRKDRAWAGSVDAKSAISKASPPSVEGPLWSFRRFVASQADDCTAADALVQQYTLYRDKVYKHCAGVFFDAYKSYGILQDKCHPDRMLRLFDQRNLETCQQADKFVGDLRSAVFEGLSLVTPADVKLTIRDSEHPQVLACRKDDVISFDENISFAMGVAPHFAYDPYAHTLTFKDFSPMLSLWDVYEVLQPLQGFLTLTATGVPSSGSTAKRTVSSNEQSEDSTSALPSRILHASFDTERSMQLASEKLQGLEIKGVRVPSQESERCTPCVHMISADMSKPEQVAADVSLAAKVIASFDANAGVPSDTTAEVLNAGSDQLEKQLDLRLLYLRRVHQFCYYKAKRYGSCHELASACGVACLRRTTCEPTEEASSAQQVDHAKQLSQFAVEGVVPSWGRPQLARASLACSERLAIKMNSNVLELGENRFGCSLCPKKFRGLEFVVKHLKQKHESELLAAVHSELNEEQMREAFFADEDFVNSVVPQPVTVGLDDGNDSAEGTLPTTCQR